MFRDYLVQQHGVENNKIEYLPQYAPAQFDMIPPSAEHKETVDLMFAGNIGAAQNLQVVLNAAEILRNEKKLRWHIVGDGSELENLKRLAVEKKLDNVIFYGRKPPEKMPKYYAIADAMLVTLTADKFISLTLPGKIQTYMAAGKPIIASATGEIPTVLQDTHCGYCVAPDDARALADAVRTFMNTNEKAVLGQNARMYYETHFLRDKFMNRLENTLIDNASKK